MDLDSFYREFSALKRRVEPMIEEYEAHVADRPAGDRPRRARSEARHHLAAGDLGAAGKALGLDRAHGGKEDDASYGRRLRAEVGVPEAPSAGPEAPQQQTPTTQPPAA
jgi:hypothetical protein